MEKNVLQWELKVTSIEENTRHCSDNCTRTAHITNSWAMSRPISKETAEAVINEFSVRTLQVMIITRRQIGPVRI